MLACLERQPRGDVLGQLRGALCASVSLGTVCGVAVLGCRWPGQPRLLRDPPYGKEYEGLIDCKCAAWPYEGQFACVGGSSDEWSVCGVSDGIRGVRAASWRGWAAH